MEAFVQLALIEKAKRVFAVDPDVDLCFPLLSPLTFTAAELAAVVAPASAADYAAAADFARIVNFVPRGLVANASGPMLWDIYRDVLDRADVASTTRQPADGADQTSMLFTTAPDGSRVESDALKRYRQYRDAWFAAREDYGQHKLSAEEGDDPEVRKHWTEVDEPALRGVLDTAENDWETLGQRALIEQALQALRATALDAPRARWTEWQNAFNPDVDMATDAGGNRYAPTGYSPLNFAEQNAWLSFDLSAAEMRSLVAAAPDSLKVVLDDDTGALLESVAFEYRSVTLVRPWFDAQALTSGIWRSEDPGLRLSDGADPPQGTCPAYPVACVFVRKIVVREAGSDTPKPRRDLRFTLDANLLAVRDHRTVKLDPQILKRVPVRDMRTPAPAPAPPVSVTARLFRALDASTFTVATPSPAHAAALAVRTAVARPVWHSTLAARPLRPVAVVPRPHPVGPPAPPAPAPESEELSVLAFICKRLPKTPDPAPGLEWNRSD